MMNLLDLIIALVLALGAIRGFRKGFFHEVASLAALVAGVFLAILVASIMGRILDNLFSWNIQLVQIITFFIVFLVVAGFIRLLGKMLTGLFKALMLGFINKLAGILAALVKWGLILAIAFMLIDYFDSANALISEERRSGSILYPLLEQLYLHITGYLDMGDDPKQLFTV